MKTVRLENETEQVYAILESKGDTFTYSVGRIGFPAHITREVNIDEWDTYIKSLKVVNYIEAEGLISENTQKEKVNNMLDWLGGVTR